MKNETFDDVSLDGQMGGNTSCGNSLVSGGDFMRPEPNIASKGAALRSPRVFSYDSPLDGAYDIQPNNIDLTLMAVRP